MLFTSWLVFPQFIGYTNPWLPLQDRVKDRARPWKELLPCAPVVWVGSPAPHLSVLWLGASGLILNLIALFSQLMEDHGGKPMNLQTYVLTCIAIDCSGYFSGKSVGLGSNRSRSRAQPGTRQLGELSEASNLYLSLGETLTPFQGMWGWR